MIPNQLALAVDVGGTKMLAAVVDSSGRVLARKKTPTPRGTTATKTLKTLTDLINETVNSKGFSTKDFKGVGIAIPGIVVPETGQIAVTANMNLSGMEIGQVVSEKTGLPVLFGNDANLGALGSQWMEGGKNAQNMIGIFIGTGIGGGIIINGRLLTGARQVAGEIGHVCVVEDGPVCGCGNKGCIEALASRSAMERQIRERVEAGEKTVLTKLLKGDLSVIKSSKFKQALEEKDKLVTDVVANACKQLGKAIISFQHILDPDLIVLGGGVVEACGKFMLPIIKKAVSQDKLVKNQQQKRIIVTTLGDDAVILGAAALVFKDLNTETAENTEPSGKGLLVVDGKSYHVDLFENTPANKK